MRNQQEIRELMEKLEKLSGFVREFGSLRELYNKDVQFACNASDILSWVLGEVTSVRLTSEYMNLKHLEETASLISRRTGNKFERSLL